MALFEKTLQAIETLDRELTTENETFKAERNKLLETLKDPEQQIKEKRNALREATEERKRVFSETVRSEFESVREKINEAVTTAPPADFVTTLETIRANGAKLTDFEAMAFIEKYKGNFIATRTLYNVLAGAGKQFPFTVIKPDSIAEEAEQLEQTVTDWGIFWNGSNLLGAMLIESNGSNPIKVLESKVESFISGNFISEN